MNARDQFEQRLPASLEELAVPRTPSYYDDVIRTTARTAQRPAWTFPGRWIPMSAITDRLATTPRVPLRVVALAGLLILALVATIVLLAGTRRPPVPAPFGPAANGTIAYVDDTGAILAANPATGENRVLIPGSPDNDLPAFSPDGTRLAWARSAGPGRWDIMVAASDGNSPSVLSEKLSEVGFVTWLADSRSVVVGSGSSGAALRILDADGAAPVRDLAGPRSETLDAFNLQPADFLRPPDGRQVVYAGVVDGDPALFVAAVDGSAGEPILTSASSGLRIHELSSPQWSPDGTRLAVTVLEGDHDYRVYVLNADGSDLRRLTAADRPGTRSSEANPQWSPDGTRIALQRWLNSDGGTDVRPITVVDVESGEPTEVGTSSSNGFNGWGWSPDGRFILAIPEATGEILLLRADGPGDAQSTGWVTSSGAVWQRLAP